MILAVLILCSLPLPLGYDRVERCDLIEVCHVWDDDGDKFLYSQVIYWDWHGRQGRHHVAAWRLLKATPGPQRDYARGEYRDRFTTSSGREVTVTAPTRRETWHYSNADPELLDRAAWPKEHRRFGVTGF